MAIGHAAFMLRFSIVIVVDAEYEMLYMQTNH